MPITKGRVRSKRKRVVCQSAMVLFGSWYREKGAVRPLQLVVRWLCRRAYEALGEGLLGRRVGGPLLVECGFGALLLLGAGFGLLGGTDAGGRFVAFSLRQCAAHAVIRAQTQGGFLC